MNTGEKRSSSAISRTSADGRGSDLFTLVDAAAIASAGTANALTVNQSLANTAKSSTDPTTTAVATVTETTAAADAGKLSNRDQNVYDHIVEYYKTADDRRHHHC